jgi:hypothetical protein
MNTISATAVFGILVNSKMCNVMHGSKIFSMSLVSRNSNRSEVHHVEIKSRLKMDICAVIPFRMCHFPICYLETQRLKY